MGPCSHHEGSSAGPSLSRGPVMPPGVSGQGSACTENTAGVGRLSGPAASLVLCVAPTLLQMRRWAKATNKSVPEEETPGLAGTHLSPLAEPRGPVRTARGAGAVDAQPPRPWPCGLAGTVPLLRHLHAASHKTPAPSPAPSLRHWPPSSAVKMPLLWWPSALPRGSMSRGHT